MIAMNFGRILRYLIFSKLRVELDAIIYKVVDEILINNLPEEESHEADFDNTYVLYCWLLNV